MRVALISTDYPPLNTSAAVQMRDLAREFAAQGHEPVVIIPDVSASYAYSVETVDGVTVLRLAAKETRAKTHARRAFAEAMLPFAMLRNLKKSPYIETPWDYIVWYSPPIFFGPLIWAMRRSSGGYGYLILRDIFPEWAVDLGVIRKGPIFYAFKAIAAFQYALSDTIGVQTSSNLKYMERWANYRRRVEVLSNWLGMESEVPCRIQIATTRFAGRVIFVYIGNMGIAQGMDILFDLAATLKSRTDIGFLFVGRGSEFSRLATEVEFRKLDNVMLLDEIDSSEVPGLLSQCSVGLVALDRRHRSHNIPGKFVSYMRYGLPVLASLNENTDLGRLIEEKDVGRAYAGSNVDELRKRAEELAGNATLRSEMSVRARALNESMFLPSTAVHQIIGAKRSVRSANHVRSPHVNVR